MGAGVVLGECPLRVRYPIELKMVNFSNNRVKVVQHIAQTTGLLNCKQLKRRNNRHVNIGQDAQAPQAHTTQLKHFGIFGDAAVKMLAISSNQTEPLHLAR